MNKLIRPMTEEEMVIYREANELGVGYKEGTNINPLHFILTGRIEELKQLIKDKKEVAG